MFLRIDTVILDMRGQACPNYPKKKVCYFFLHYLKKEVSDEFDFLHADKCQSFLHIDTMIFNADGQAFPKFSK